MTRTELMKYTMYVLQEMKPAYITRLTKKAGLIHYDDTIGVDILISYASLVAIHSRRTGTLYCFGTYSNTTVKHMYKAARILKVSRLVWLCERRDHAIETYIDGRDQFKGRRWEIDNLIKFDWSMEIETKWKFMNQ